MISVATKLYRQNWYLNNKERLIKYQKEYSRLHPERNRLASLKSYYKHRTTYLQNRQLDRELNPDKYTNQRLYSKHKITLEQYRKLLQNQNNRCAICDKSESKLINGIKARLAVDHDHKSGLIRGLLCYACNVGLGFFNDDTEVLKRAIEYVNKDTQVS